MSLALPTRGRLLDSDIVAICTVVSLGIVALWVRHGGAGALLDGWVPFWTSLTQISGLLASGFGLAGLVLIARLRPLERRVGLDRLFIWHRIIGETMAILVAVHIAAALVSWSAGGVGVLTAIQELTGREPYMAAATVGGLVIGLVTISSLASIRRRFSYETWYFVHLLAYVGFAIAYGHEIVLGHDLANDSVARWYFGLVHVGVIALVVWGRWGRLAIAAVRPLRLVAVTPLAPGTSELRLGGPNLADRVADSGQFFVLRPMAWRLWWQAHPFSLSGAPTTDGLRFTVKDRGDATKAMIALPLGTRFVAEGPYGTVTPSVLGDDKVLFVVGGVGVAPVRAMLERLGPHSRPEVVYRAHSQRDLVHLDELVMLAQARGGRVHTLVGPSATLAVRDPFSASVLRRVVPDLAERVAFLCGPERLVYAARKGLRDAGLPADRIHYERPWW
jgi:predicted ferric reductase